MTIRNDHFFLSSAADIREIAKPLLSLGITYFSYSHYYDNGGRLWLCNNPEILENYYTKKLYRIGNTEARPSTYQSHVALWSTLPNQKVFDNARQLGVDHGIFTIEPQHDSCEFFAFGTTPDNHKIINTYLTELDFLKKFCHFFKKEASSLIKKGEKSKIYLPYHNNPITHQNKSDLDFLITKEFPKRKLTPRQMTCAKLLMQGYTVREIAALQELSPRTVETYLNNMKTKLSCRNKSDLISKLTIILS